MEYLRRAIIDIEVKIDKEFPHPAQAKYPFSAITLWDSYTKHYYSLIVVDSPEPIEKVVMSPEWDIYYCNSEMVLATNFAKIFHLLNVDTLEGFFSKTFDFPYICNRFKNIELDPNILSPGGHFSSKFHIQSSGLHLLDIVEADRKFKKRSNESLKSIAEEEKLPINKLEFNFDETKHTPEQLAAYNKTDVEVTLALDNKMQHIKRYVNRWQLAGLESIDKAMSNSVVVDTVMLREAKKLGILLPSKPDKNEAQQSDTEESDITGGKVFEPEIGIHNNVMVFDMSRFYPSMILSLRLSPENISENGTITAADGTKYIDNQNAFLPKIINHFFKERDRIQAELKNKIPNTQEYQKLVDEDENAKFLLNSVFGVFGAKTFRLYDPRIANSVTQSCQNMIKHAKVFIESKGYSVIYGDTDSIFIKIKNDKLEEIVDAGLLLTQELNNMFVIWMKEEFNVENTSLKIAFDKIFSRVMFIPNDKGESVKKRYAGRLIWTMK